LLVVFCLFGVLEKSEGDGVWGGGIKKRVLGGGGGGGSLEVTGD